MKTRLLQIGRIGVAALIALVVTGCAQSSATNTSTAAVQPTNTAPAAPPATNSDSKIAAVTESAPPPERAEPAPGSEARPTPAELKLSPATSEIVKLTQGGVQSAVLLAFVTNTTGTFNLGSDQIIYLNDLGVASDVITSMIEHDRLLREGGGALPAIVATPAATAFVAPAPQPDAATIAAAAAPQAMEQPQATEAPPAPVTTEAVPAPPAGVTYNYFYDSLSPYGTWIEVEGYGRCWQPSTVVLQPGWRPYCHGGRWIYSDYGWYWHSDYSWGWAPFHYGRWFTHPRWGWCWYPDTVWGPSWVSWSYTDAYCGWAPLPPAACYTAGVGFTWYGSSVGIGFGFGLGWGCYSYVPWNHFHGHHGHHDGHHYARHCAPPHHARDIHQHATVVNNVIVGNNNTIINKGIGVDRIGQYTKRELRPVRVREEGIAGRGPNLVPGDRLERGGKELVIRRPNLPPTSPATTATRQSPNRLEAGSVSTTSFSDRRATMEPRSGRTPSPAVTTGSNPEGGSPGRSTVPAGNTTRGESRDAVATRPLPTRVTEPTGNRFATASPRTVPSAAASAAARTETPAARRETPQASGGNNNVITFGRRESTPTTSAGAASRPVPATTLDRSRANTTTTWTRSSPTSPNVALNNPATTTPVRTQPTRSASVPTMQTPAAPANPRSSMPSPVVRSEARPSAPVTTMRPSSAPSYSAPAMRSAPAPTPAPSVTPRPAPAAPPAPAAASPSRSAPTPQPSSPPSSSAGRSEGGRGGQRQQR